MATQGPWGGNDKGGGNNGDEGKRPEPKRPPANEPLQPPRPWGTPPGGAQKPPPRGTEPPEFDEMVRRGQERLRVLMGGGQGTGRGPSDPKGPAFSKSTGLLAALAIGAFWVFNSFYTVDEGERSVELLFGRPVAVGAPGLNFAPWPVVTAEIVPTTGERVTEIGAGRSGVMDSGLMLTKDQNIVDMQYQVVWNVSDPEKFLFNLADPEETVRAVAESAMRDIVARSELAPILNRDRETVRIQLEEAVQKTLDLYESGISVVRVNLDRADPPAEVIDSFREVQAAQQERDRLEKEADAYANRVLASARGEAARLIEESEAYRAQAVNTAEGEAARFKSVYAEYAKAPDVTRKRMYLETMEKVLSGVDKIILDGPAANGVVPYLPLDRLGQGKSEASKTEGGN